ncbi:hypothetical protein Acr_00g0011740 [Actinidia rufa]|uniref:Uncharacterized protein n=1 Tax=Actinidia rufa TaxID=165716 RepID=A0A7J0D9J3_9ERIC|nr:hypothetical protein Acr_00g0011740 [Actinidia rufa]
MDQVEGDVPGEDISEQSLMRRLVLETSERDYSGETNERVPESYREEVKRRGQRRGQKKEVRKRGGTRRIVQETKHKISLQKVATTAMMAVDESDVLLAASIDEESDWIFDSGIAYHLCRDREMFSTHVACEGLVQDGEQHDEELLAKEQSGSA